MKYIFTFLILLLFLKTNAQGLKASYLKMGFGYYQNTTTLFTDDLITDKLIGYSKKNYSIAATMGAVNSKSLGLELTLMAVITDTPLEKRKFIEQANRMFSDQYFVEATTIGGDSREFIHALFGITYTLKFKDFLLRPKYSIGITNIFAQPGFISLKEIGSNNRFEYSYDKYKDPKSEFYFLNNPAITLGYKFNNQLYLNLDLNYFFYKLDLSYYKEQKDLIFNTSSNSQINYNKTIHSYAIGLGFSYYITNK